MELELSTGVKRSGACRPDGDTAGEDDGSKVGRRGGGGVEGYEGEGEGAVW